MKVRNFTYLILFYSLPLYLYFNFFLFVVFFVFNRLSFFLIFLFIVNFFFHLLIIEFRILWELSFDINLLLTHVQAIPNNVLLLLCLIHELQLVFDLPIIDQDVGIWGFWCSPHVDFWFFPRFRIISKAILWNAVHIKVLYSRIVELQPFIWLALIKLSWIAPIDIDKGVIMTKIGRSWMNYNPNKLVVVMSSVFLFIRT